MGGGGQRSDVSHNVKYFKILAVSYGKKKKAFFFFFLTLSKVCISLPVSSLKKFILPKKIRKDYFYYSVISISSIGAYCLLFLKPLF